MLLRALAAVACVALAACGASEKERLGRAALAEAEPVVAGFAADLDAGRYEEARARTTPAFQAAASGDAMRTVMLGQTGVLGRLAARENARVEEVASAEAPSGPVAQSVAASWDARFAKDAARIEARLRRAGDGSWRIDAWCVRSKVFTWTLR